jgi:hypothetical protein
MRSGPTLAALAALAVIAAPHGAPASLILALDAPTLVARADTIAVVDVAASRAAWDERHERIVTTVDLQVVESWKGGAAPAARVTVVQPGGTVGDITMVVFGMPRFSPGERALVYLAGAPERARVVGMAQGKRLVRPDPASGRPMVQVADRGGASFVRGTRAATTPPALEARARPLDELRAEVLELVARGGSR